MQTKAKESIRKISLNKRDKLDEEYKAKASKEVISKLLTMDAYKEADIVLSYASFRSELSTREINQKILEDGKELYLPKTFIKEKKIFFYQIKDLKKDLKSGAYGILEPDTKKDLKIIDKDYMIKSKKNFLIIMPGVAYDKKGYRMGYGGGYYDRFLGNIPAGIKKVMLAFRIQLVENTYSEDYDIKPDMIITD